MGCKIECTICCKKKKQYQNQLPVEKKDTKFVAENFHRLKIEIKNNDNSNSRDIPLINNFFRETLGKKKTKNSQKSISMEKTEENKETKDIKENKDYIQSLVNDNLYKGTSEQLSGEQINKDNKSEKSKKTQKSHKSDKSKKSKNKQSNTSKNSIQIIESNRTNKSNKSNKINKSNTEKFKDLKTKTFSGITINLIEETNKNNDSSNIISEEQNNIKSKNSDNNNTALTNILHNSTFKKNLNNNFSLITSKNELTNYKSNKEVFVDYKTFIKGKPYTELSKEYKHGIDIGEGGFGKVKTIIHKKTGQLRAMKLIKKSKEFNLDEIENLMLLNHPNILKLYEYYYDEKDNIYIITEYIRGEELFNKLQEVIRFKEKDAAIIIKSVLQAIAYCHSRGIIHRDLKPENILVPTGNNKIDYTLLKIIDFGASVLKKDDGKISFRFGTPYYIAPEVLQESYNEKCDVWSIGVILHLLLLGQVPFDGEDDNVICQKIVTEEINFDNSKFKNLSKEAVDFLKKLLEKNQDKRISSAQALEHVWIKKFAPQTKVNRAFSRKIYKNLSNFREESQLSTVVVTFITNYLMNDEELKLLKKLFFELDVKGTGVITKNDLFRGMEECFDKKITREEVDKIFSNIDYDNNGTISFDEFVKAAIDKKKLLTEEKLKAAFALFDRNGDGDIEAKELKEVIGDENEIEDNVWFKMIEEVDLDGNGVIDFDEFKIMMKKLCA